MKLNSLKLFVFHFILILNRNAQFLLQKKKTMKILTQDMLMFNQSMNI